MSNRRLSNVEHFAWTFLQSLWVGGIWITLLVIFPTLGKSILAPILVYDVIAQMEPKIIIVVVLCATLQLYLFINASNYRLVFKTLMGTGIATVLVISIIFLTMHELQILDYRLRGIMYVAIALLGLFLTFQLPPWLQNKEKSNN